MSITDELRKIAAKTERASGRCEKLYRGDLDHAADRIDERIEREYVKLPVDADGVPIHVGDRVENNERVVRIVLTDDSWEPSVYVEKLPNVLHEYFCHEVSHYQPDSWERIIGDAVKNVMYDHDNERIQQKLVERCKRLAGEA